MATSIEEHFVDGPPETGVSYIDKAVQLFRGMPERTMEELRAKTARMRKALQVVVAAAAHERIRLNEAIDEVLEEGGKEGENCISLVIYSIFVYCRLWQS